MAPIHGKDGSVREGLVGTVAHRVVGWRVDNAGPVLHDATPLQATWQALAASQQVMTGVVICDWDQSDTAQTNLHSDVFNVTLARIQLYVNGSNRFTGDVFLRLLAEASVGGTVRRLFAFESRGTMAFL